MNESELVTGAAGVLPDGVSWRLGGEVDVLRVYHLELGLAVDLLNDVCQRPVRLTLGPVDLGRHSENLSELDGRTVLVVLCGDGNGIGDIRGRHACRHDHWVDEVNEDVPLGREM